MRDGAGVLGRGVITAFVAALFLTLVVAVQGSRAAEAAPQSKSGVTVTVTVSPPTEVYGVINADITNDINNNGCSGCTHLTLNPALTAAAQAFATTWDNWGQIGWAKLM